MSERRQAAVASQEISCHSK